MICAARRVRENSMINFVISACLISSPAVCKDHNIPLDGEYDQKSCMMSAPPYLAQWASDHPAWEIKRWKCVPGNQNDI